MLEFKRKSAYLKPKTRLLPEVMMIDSLGSAIIAELEKNGRQSYVNLAKSLRVSETTVRYRIKRLLDTGVV